MNRINRRITLPLDEVRKLHKGVVTNKSHELLFRTLWSKVHASKAVAKQAYIGKDGSLYVYMITEDVNHTAPKKHGVSFGIQKSGDITVHKYDTDSLTELRNLVRHDVCEK